MYYYSFFLFLDTSCDIVTSPGLTAAGPSQRFWNTVRLKKANALGFSPDEVITLASIVHEESKQA